ncbi:queuosine precursor transporter [Pseudomaricurvus alkylphenolicus]|uniref:queuosine precursor transporter n=1 Tax=Pseudomaricurvus alkylphenolicus TaxID=1306991 RepID=UPI001421FA5D|nr:queuosine precursor transporter [Pseudomaricurvus alkylphenolicus]NIB39807.1 queuosine precursor transporter [Pseudomaricurvus alkylphenolicus]
MEATLNPATEAAVDADLRERRERVFLVLAGVFLCSMTLLNVIGISRFVQLGPLALAVGVLPYPLTFLCTDLICELYGKKRANFLVTVGLCLNFFILGCMYLGQLVAPVDASAMPPWQVLHLAADVPLPDGSTASGSVELFDLMYSLTSGAVFASMMAYTAAQYCDVKLFHFWKRLTKGRHLWLRNNFSTLISQAVDSFMVVSVTFGAVYLAGGITTQQLLVLMGSNYLFKMTCALLDTGPFYYLTYKLKRYLQMN